MNLELIPNLSQEVAIAASCAIDETVGPACFMIGVVAGVYINNKTA
jgi:hypothetical protein